MDDALARMKTIFPGTPLEEVDCSIPELFAKAREKRREEVSRAKIRGLYRNAGTYGRPIWNPIHQVRDVGKETSKLPRPRVVFFATMGVIQKRVYWDADEFSIVVDAELSSARMGPDGLMRLSPI